MSGASVTPDIVPLPQRRGLRVLQDAQLAALQEATLTVLEEVGVHVPSARARELLGDNGARVGADAVVRIPADLVARAMATAPRSLLLAGREERFDLVLDGEHSYVATEGVGVHVVDPETRALRASCTADVAQMARVCDALPLLTFFWPPVSAQDHGITAPLHECHASLTNTLKHVRGATTVRPSLSRFIIDMATVVAGGEAQRRRRPPICGNICTISPLAHDEHGLECAIAYAEAGIPFSFMAMTTMGTVAPATTLGALVQGDAEVVSGLVIAQLAAPGAPVFHSVLVSVVDPYSGGYISEVPLPVGWMAVELAHAWGVPSIAGGGLDTDDAAVGWLAGRNAGLGAALSVLCGGEICGYLGLTGGSTILYPEQLILQHETLIDVAAELGASGMPGMFQFDPADLALDVIREVGPRGHFLKHRHTRGRLRDLRFPPWVRPPGGEAAGATTAGSRAAGAADLDDQATRASGGVHPAAPAAAALEEYRRLAREHAPAPLPDDALAALDGILAAADREAAELV
jgi:trimethylamine--corrinoid protein Co-methyltransferase